MKGLNAQIFKLIPREYIKNKTLYVLSWMVPFNVHYIKEPLKYIPLKYICRIFFRMANGKKNRLVFALSKVNSQTQRERLCSKKSRDGIYIK